MSTCRKLSLEVCARCVIVIVCTILTNLASTAVAVADSNGITEGGCGCYIIAQGDTLRGIAVRLLGDEARWPELFAANRNVARLPDGWVLTDPDLLLPGLQLRLPDGVPAAPAVVPAITSPGLPLSISTVGVGQASSQGSSSSNVPASAIPGPKMAQPQVELIVESPLDGAVHGTTVEIPYHITGMKSIHSPLPLTEAGKHPEINRPGEEYLLYQLDLQPEAVQSTDGPIKLTNVPMGEHTLLVELETDDHPALSPAVAQQIRFRTFPVGLPNTGAGGARNYSAVVPATTPRELLPSTSPMGTEQTSSQGSDGFNAPTSAILEPRMVYAAWDASTIDLSTDSPSDPALLTTALGFTLPAWLLTHWLFVVTLGLVAVPHQRKQIVPAAPKQVIPTTPKRVGGDRDAHAQAEFVSMVSHELKNQLVIVHQYATLLMNYSHQLTNEQRETYLRTIHKESGQLIQLVHDLSDVSKVESGILDYNKQRCNFTDLVLDVCQQYQTVSPRHTLVWQLEEGVQAFADSLRIDQVLVNLLDNAVKYSPHGGEIVVRLTTSTNGREACFSVTDQGIGLAAEELPLLFQRFSRVRNEYTAAIGGTGLGLYICAKILEAHGGSYRVQSSPGRGTMVTFTLPLAAYTTEGVSAQASTTPGVSTIAN